MTLSPEVQAAGALDLLADASPDRVALRTADRALTYAELSAHVSRRAAQLSPGPGLEHVVGERTVDSVVHLLAAWRAGRTVLMLPPDATQRERLVAAWPVDAAYDPHPELALLMSTSGTTGSPKLVRLSRDAVRANAEAIAGYLELTPDDLALTTLPLHYCYGLSVLTSHLVAGAGVLLTDESVTSPGLWAEAARAGVSSFAGVPHTFELLERSGCADALPSTLRYVTQAGGRMAPDRVRDWARRGEDNGFDLVVMYGQTEATARMAWLPPHLVADRLDAIGIPVPGGSLRIAPLADSVTGVGEELGVEVGELVYSGTNVMMGYAETPADLARGPGLTELRTGDLGVQDEDGVFRVVGRLARFAKVYGLRLDLDGVEETLATQGIRARLLEHDDRLAVFVTQGRTSLVRSAVASAAGLPAHAVRVVLVPELPVSAAGKRDDAPLRELLACDPGSGSGSALDGADDRDLAVRIRDMYAVLLGRTDATTGHCFTDLRGDSLSYVEAAVRLDRIVGSVPPDWARLTPDQLAVARAAPDAPDRRRRWHRMDTSLLLRAAAIVLVIGSHTDLWAMPGGAHTLLALVGFSLVRFQLSVPGRRERVSRILQTFRAVALPSFLVMAVVALTRGSYEWPTVLGLNNLVGVTSWDDQWRMWFVEAVVWGLAGAAALLAVPAVHRTERRHPFALPAVLWALSVAVRWASIGWEADNPQRYSVPFVWTFLLLGWLVARAHTTRQRLYAAGAVALSTIGFFGDPVREAVVAGALMLLLLVPQVRLPAVLIAPVGVLAASSLWVYLLHWEVYPPIEEVNRPVAFLASFAVGIPAWWLWTRVPRWWRADRPEPAQSQ